MFRTSEHKITFIEQDEDRCRELEDRYHSPIYQGDGTKKEILEQVGLDEARGEDMYQTMAIANYEDRFVVPTNHKELSTDDAYGERSGCGFSFGDGCHTSGVSRMNLFGSKNPERREHNPVSVWSPPGETEKQE